MSTTGTNFWLNALTLKQQTNYARFIESARDRVLNAALKKVLWRDQNYRKSREQRRSGSEKGAAQPDVSRGLTETESRLVFISR